MTAAIGNLVHQTSTTTGTGNKTLSAENGKQSFNTAFGTGGTDVFYYFISNRDAAEWEVGTGHMSDATTLVSDTVINSSNSDAAVNFSAGTKDVLNDFPASIQGNIVFDTTPQLGGQLDVNGNAIGDGTLELLSFTETASAVNQVNLTNAATGTGPTIAAAGDDTNIDLNLDGKGTGVPKTGGEEIAVLSDITSKFVGCIIDWPLETAPSFGLTCQGGAYVRNDYQSLFSVIAVRYGDGDGVAVTGSADNGSGLIRLTATSHGLTTSDVVGVANVGGTTEANGFWTVTVIDVNTVDLQGSTFSNTYTSGGNIGTTFNVPDRRGEHVRGWANGSANDPDRASRTDRGDGTGGDVVGAKQTSMYASHTHGISDGGNFISAGSSPNRARAIASASVQSVASGGNETRGRNVTTNYCIIFE